MEKKLKVGFIGAGAVASALAAGLAQRGYDIAAVSSRGFASAMRLAGTLPACAACRENQLIADWADLVVIATPDDAIAPVCETVAWRTGQMVVHCSGADTSAKLSAARAQGAHTGVCHPLQTFAPAGQSNTSLDGITFAIEAEEPLLSVLKEMAASLGGRAITLQPGDRALYHAAAVMVCNYLTTLTKLATDLWAEFGVSQPEAVAALLPLMRGTLNNIEKVGLPQCLTGPIARGDTGTLRRHLTALEQRAPALLPAYRTLGLETIPVALAKGRIDEQKAQEMKDLLQGSEVRV